MREPEILFSNEDFIVVDKPAGLPVHGGGAVEGRTLADFLVSKFPELKSVGDEPAIRPGLVHRLDKETSGVMIVARNQRAFEDLKGLFKKRLVKKTYSALVCGKFREDSGVINFPIGRLKTNPTKRGVPLNPKMKLRNMRDALTEYSVADEVGEYSLVDVFPKTGRMHQIRVHMAALGRPVACDRKYGGKGVRCPPGLGRLFLHARAIDFSYPEGKKWHFEAELPADLKEALDTLAKTAHK